MKHDRLVEIQHPFLYKKVGDTIEVQDRRTKEWELWEVIENGREFVLRNGDKTLRIVAVNNYTVVPYDSLLIGGG